MATYNRREFLDTLSKGCASMGVTSLLSGITNMGLLNAAAAANAPVYNQNDYKALICIYMRGGNDSFNMLVPRGISEYTQYANTRSGLAIQQAELLPINPSNVTDRLFGLHPELPDIQNLFENGNAAFIANIGTLIRPTTLTTYNDREYLPIGLYSHNDQEMLWQTCVPQSRVQLGWGGRMADILHANNANQNISMNIALDGINTFQRGNIVDGYTIESADTGSVVINGSDQNNFYENLKRQSLDNLLDVNYQNILKQAYSGAVVGAKNNSLEFSAAITNAPAINTVFPNTDIGKRLQMVAKTISARDNLNVSRQTFFAAQEGFDNHRAYGDHSTRMTEFNDAVKAMYDALVEMGMENQVTIFTMSDFGRKLVFNGQGSDHGWGGNATIIGGAVDGQKIYGEYPELYLGNSLDTGGGRIIPTTSCDEYFAELALWFGAATSDLDQIFPNINNFWTPTADNGPIGFMV